MRRNLLYCLAACAVMLHYGCAKMENGRGKNGPIRINVKTTGATKSAAITTSSLEAAGKFVLDVIVDDSYTEVDSDGKAIPSTLKSAGSYIISGGKANVLYSSASNPYTAENRDDDSDQTDGWYIYDDSKYEPYNWINGVKMHFWARYPENSQVDGSTGKGTLNVTIPDVGATTEGFEYSLPTAVPGSDATNQKDILFAYAERLKQKQDSNTGIDLTFHHALSEVRFCVSPDDGTFDVSLKIKRIEINYVPSSGKCTFDPSGTIADQDMFTWGSYGTLKSYSQDYNASFDVAPAGWDGSEYDTTNHKHIYTCQNAFMMIPHTTGSTAKLTITFWDSIEETDVTRSASIKNTIWKPGHYYTYKIAATKIGRTVSSYVILEDWSDRDSKINIPC